MSCKESKAQAGSTAPAEEVNILDQEIKGEEIAILTDAPEVPPQITRSHRTKMIVNLEVTEVVKRMADGVDHASGAPVVQPGVRAS